MSKRRSDPRVAEPSASRAAAAKSRLRRKRFRARWRDSLGMPVLLLIALLVTAATPTLSAGLRPVSRAGSTCSPSSLAVTRAATDGSGRGLEASGRSQLGKSGEVVGRALTASVANGAQVAVELPAESFVGDALDDVVVYTKYSPASGSQVRALDLVTGCDSLLASPSEIVRSAILAVDGTAVYVHSVNKSGRGDAGVARFDLGAGTSTQVVPPLRPSERLGPIFGTELHFRHDGGALAVQSCGIAACLTRVLGVASGAVATYDEPGQGQFISLDDESLVTYAACGAMPCDVLSIDLATSAVEVIR